jgi:hypothetical protein
MAWFQVQPPVSASYFGLPLIRELSRQDILSLTI